MSLSIMAPRFSGICFYRGNVGFASASDLEVQRLKDTAFEVARVTHVSCIFALRHKGVVFMTMAYLALCSMDVIDASGLDI